MADLPVTDPRRQGDLNVREKGLERVNIDLNGLKDRGPGELLSPAATGICNTAARAVGDAELVIALDGMTSRMEGKTIDPSALEKVEETTRALFDKKCVAPQPKGP